MTTPSNLPVRVTQLEVRQMGLRELLAIVIRRRWIIVCVALPIIVAATYGTLNKTDTVTASGRVVVETRAPEALTFQTGTINYDVIMSTAAQVAMSIPVANLAAKTFLDSLPAVHQRFPELAGIKKLGDMRDVLLGGIESHQVGESNILQISFTHTNPYFALLAAEALMAAYIQYAIESRQNIPAISYYSDEIDQVKAEVDSLLAVQAEILTQAGYTAYEDNARATSSQIVQLERTLFSIRADRMALQTKLAGFKQATQNDPDYVPVLRGSDDWNLIDLKKQLDSQIAALSKLRLEYKEDSEWIQRQVRLINDTHEQIDRQRDNYFHSLQIEIDEFLVKEKELQHSIDLQKEFLVAFPKVQQEVDAIKLSIETRLDLLESLQIKRGEVRLKAGTDQRVSNIIPLNQPSLNMVVAGSKKVLYLLLAAMFGLALGFLAALFAENQDHRLYERRQVQQYLDVPVLGSITQVSGDRE